MPQEAAKTGYELDTDFDSDFDVEPTQPEKARVTKTPETPAPLGKDAPPSAPVHNAMTLHFAREFGFEEADIASMTPKELDTAIRAAHKAMLKQSREFRRNEESPKPVETPVDDSLTNRPAVKPVEEDDLAEFKDTLHEDVIKAIKKGREKDGARIEALQKKLDETEGRERQRVMQAQYDAVDAEFAKMPTAVQQLIGKGTRYDIAQGSLQHTIRKHILEAAEKDETAGLTFAQKMHKAAKALAPAGAAEVEPEDDGLALAEGYDDEVPVQPAPKKPVPPKNSATGKFETLTQAEREEAFRQSGSAKPSNRESPLPKGEKRAMETARKIMIARGMLDESDVPEGAFPK